VLFENLVIFFYKGQKYNDQYIFFFFEGKSISLKETKFHKSYKLNETNVFETTQTSGKKTTAIKA
jgi:hypothetical protein